MAFLYFFPQQHNSPQGRLSGASLSSSTTSSSYSPLGPLPRRSLLFNVCIVVVLLGAASLFLVDWDAATIGSVIPKVSPLINLAQGIGAAGNSLIQSARPPAKADPDELFVKIREAKTDIKVEGTKLTISNPQTSEKKPLKVHVVLHSHVDPGWLESFEGYYTGKVQHILDLAVHWLTKTPHLRFIWSEMSFLERWWCNATKQQQEQMKKLISSRQLELCGGAWVMTDEATPHYAATIDNMIEGHRFVWDTFGVRPTTSWSVDPFGHGLMIPGLLPVSGVHRMVIGRINDHQKEELRKAVRMRWHWKQPYVAENRTALPSSFVNVLPFMYYTTRNACGPDDQGRPSPFHARNALQVCCKYHLGPSGGGGCSGTVHQVTNIKAHAEELIGQYRKTASFYNSERVLIAVGDDFYLTKEGDWQEIVDVYSAIADYVNKTPEMHAEMRFSTVEEFFDGIKEEEVTAPSLTGDFFPYVQSEHQPNRWWTGYFTHRPFFKRMSRIVESKLRTFDLLNVLSGSGMFGKEVTKARRDLALFQHHDAITGTSKRHVMEDYLERLVSGHSVLSRRANEAMAVMTNRPMKAVQAVDVTPEYKRCESVGGFTARQVQKGCTPTELPHDRVIAVPHGMKVTILAFNPVLGVNDHVVRLTVNREDIVVEDGEGNVLPAQINPVFGPGLEMTKDVFELVFIGKVPPLGNAEFVLTGAKAEKTAVAKFIEEKSPEKMVYSLKNEVLEVKIFNAEVDNIVLNGKALNIQLGTTNSYDRGGAYVLDTNQQQRMSVGKPVKAIYIKGPVETKLASFYKEGLLKSIRLVNSPIAHLAGAIDIRVLPHTKDSQALFFEVSSSMLTNGKFSTDANGMYMMKRTYNEVKDFDANVFPAASSAFLEDKLHRLSVHLGQPNGVAADAHGKMQILIDRVVNTDDGKGLPYGEDFDEHNPDVRLRLFPEGKAPEGESLGAAHSLPSHRALETLRNPLALFLVKQPGDGDYADVHPPSPPSNGSAADEEDDDEKTFAGGPTTSFSLWPCQLDLVSLRRINEKEVLAIIRRVTFDEAVEQSTEGCTSDLAYAWNALVSMGSSLKMTNLAGTSEGVPASLQSFRSALQSPYAIVSIAFTPK